MFKLSVKLSISLLLLNSWHVFAGNFNLVRKLPSPYVFTGVRAQTDGVFSTEAASDNSDPLGLFEPVACSVKAWTGMRGLKDSLELPRTKEMLASKKSTSCGLAPVVVPVAATSKVDEKLFLPVVELAALSPTSRKKILDEYYELL